MKATSKRVGLTIELFCILRVLMDLSNLKSKLNKTKNNNTTVGKTILYTVCIILHSKFAKVQN